MKGALLDTHALLWMVLGDARMPRRVQNRINETEGLAYSVVSFWEIALKLSRGGFDFELPSTWDQELTRELREIRVQRIGLEVAHCRQLQELPWHHKDPFDRMLIAQAQVESLALFTADPRFREYDLVVAW